MMIKIFKTDVSRIRDAFELSNLLQGILELKRATFDLDDTDHVLRVEGDNYSADEVLCFLEFCGFEGKELV
ncbi:hypothetical protein ACFRAE_12035 [Sphingobacterium sp. HJSM2_6]|uniref:hypothetical protein n=1 Tax=Sphingobacterium sp. HJSM2_6 TaxID=3366264 RepID=UPI003BCE388D